MVHIRLFSIFLSLFFCVSAGGVEIQNQINVAGSPCRHSPTSFECVDFIENYDGDTIKVNIPRVHHFFGNETPIRIQGIDTPEIISDSSCERDLAAKAAMVTENLLRKAKRIDLRNVKRGKYFRVVADVYINHNKNLGKELLKRRLAVESSRHGSGSVNWCRLP